MNLKSFLLASILALPLAGCGGGGGGGGSPEPLPIVAPLVNGVASMAGSRGEYTIAKVSGGKYSVTDRTNNSVTNVVDATAIGFSDVTINLGIGDKAVALGMTNVQSLIELYIAFLKQVPDADSLSLWIGRGLTLGDAADQLAQTGYSASLTNAEFVTAMYKNVFGRFGTTAPTSTELQFWTSRLDKVGLNLGITRGALVLEMLAAARSGSGDLATQPIVNLLDNKVTVGQYFAVQQGINFNAESSSRRAAIAEAVTATDVAAAKGLIGFSDSAFNLALGG